MHRIPKDRCGYSGYTCVGVDPILNNPLFSDVFCDETDYDGSLYSEPAGNNYNNYKNLPRCAMGAVMTTEFIDLSGVQAPVPPEKSCAVNVNPFASNGFIDIYETYSEKGSISDILCYQDPDLSDTEDPYANCYKPGFLEPMLETDFSPLSITEIPALDITVNNLMSVIQDIQNWRHDIINPWIKNTGTPGLRYLGAIAAALSATKAPTCEGFRIYLRTGGKFGVTAGIALYGDQAIKCKEKKDFEIGDSVYVEVKEKKKESGDGITFEAELVKKKPEVGAYIGVVLEAKGACTSPLTGTDIELPYEPGSNYAMYFGTVSIYQAACSPVLVGDLRSAYKKGCSGGYLKDLICAGPGLTVTDTIDSCHMQLSVDPDIIGMSFSTENDQVLRPLRDKLEFDTNVFSIEEYSQQGMRLNPDHNTCLKAETSSKYIAGDDIRLKIKLKLSGTGFMYWNGTSIELRSPSQC